MRALIGRMLRWFIDAAPPRPVKNALRTVGIDGGTDAGLTFTASAPDAILPLTRTEANAALRALGSKPWQCPCCARLREDIAAAWTKPGLWPQDAIARMRALATVNPEAKPEP